MAWADVQSELERIATSGTSAEVDRLWNSRDQGHFSMEGLYRPYVERARARLGASGIDRSKFSNLANFQRALSPYDKTIEIAKRQLAALGNWGSAWDKHNSEKTMWSEVIRPGLKVGAMTAAAGAAAAYAPVVLAEATAITGIPAAELAAQGAAAYATFQTAKPELPRMPNTSSTGNPAQRFEEREIDLSVSPYAGRGPAGSGVVSQERFNTGTRVHGGRARPEGFNPHEPDFSGNERKSGGFDL